MELKQNGYCNTCERLTEDINYIFCSVECQHFWVLLEEKQVGKYDIDKEVYIQWLNDKTPLVEVMTKEEIEARIIEVKRIEFYCEAEWALLHKQYDKITGRKGIAPWLKNERNELITDPHFKVNFDGEPRKKERKPKEDKLSELLGIDLKDLKAKLKSPKTTPVDMDDIINQIATVGLPKPTEPKATQDEIKAKADALKEKMRLAKEKKTSGQ